MILKLACTDFSFPLLDFEATLQLIAQLGFRAADIGLFEGYKHLNPSRELRSPEKSGTKLSRMLAQHDLGLADVFLIAATTREELATTNPDPADNRRSRDIFARTLDFVSAAGGRHLTQLPGVRFKGQSAVESFSRAAQELGWRVNQARSRGITLAVEPHLGSIIDSPAAALRLAREVPGLGYSLDYCHFIRAGYRQSEVDPLLARATHLHVRGANRKRLQCSFAENTIDYARIMRRLSRRDYRGFYALEYVWIEWEGCNQCDNLSETIRFRDHLNSAARPR